MRKVWCLIAAIILAGQLQVYGQEIDECLECHQDKNLTKADAAGNMHSLYVDKQAYQASVHGKNGYSCIDCHEGVVAKKHPAAGIPDVQCGTCHDEVKKKQDASKHGKLLNAGNPYAPRCYDCHSMHAVMPANNPKSTVAPGNLAATCGACHKDEANPFLCALLLNFVKGKEGSAQQFTLPSVMAPVAMRVKGHGKINMGCDYSTSRCSDCHFETVQHGTSDLKPKVCVSCHGVEKSSFIFGRIHKTGVVKSPLLAGMLVVLYLAGMGGIVLYFRGDILKKKPAKSSGETE